MERGVIAPMVLFELRSAAQGIHKQTSLPIRGRSREIKQDHIICRDTSTGEELWTADLRKFSPSSLLRDMKAADGCLYVLSDDFMRALDSATGREIWKIRLWGISQKGIWRRIVDYLDGSSRIVESARQTPKESAQKASAPSPLETTPTMRDVERLIEEGKDIAAIKAYRQIHPGKSESCRSEHARRREHDWSELCVVVKT